DAVLASHQRARAPGLSPARAPTRSLSAFHSCAIRVVTARDGVLASHQRARAPGLSPARAPTRSLSAFHSCAIRVVTARDAVLASHQRARAPGLSPARAPSQSPSAVLSSRRASRDYAGRCPGFTTTQPAGAGPRRAPRAEVLA